jgi:hypothetical protein
MRASAAEHPPPSVAAASLGPLCRGHAPPRWWSRQRWERSAARQAQFEALGIVDDAVATQPVAERVVAAGEEAGPSGSATRPSGSATRPAGSRSWSATS